MAIEIYDITADFSDQDIYVRILHTAVDEAGLTTCTAVDANANGSANKVRFHFPAPLSGPDKATLDGVVAAYDPSGQGDGWDMSIGSDFELIKVTENPASEEAALKINRDTGDLETWEDWDYHFKDLKQVRRIDLRSSFSPRMSLKHHSGPAGEQFWHFGVDTSTNLRWGTADDDNEFVSLAMQFERTGTTVNKCTVYCPMTVSGEVTASTPTLSTSLATKAYVDALVQGVEWQDSVKSVLDDPPGSPTTGDRHLVGTGTGAWAGQGDDIAEYNGASWDFTTPTQGTTLTVDSPIGYLNYNGSAWVSLGSGVSHANLIPEADGHPEYVLADGTRAFSAAPTMPGATCTADLNIDSSLPRLQFHDDDGTTDETRFRFYVASGQLVCAHVTDDQAATTPIQTWRKIESSGDVVCTITADVTITGDLAVTGTVDGRDVAADGTALDALASHAATHADGGSDELKVEDLATAGTLGQVPTSDGAGGLTMEDPSGGGSVFGSEFNLENITTSTSSASTSMVEGIRLPASGTMALPAGTYRVELSVKWSGSSTTYPGKFDIKLDGSIHESIHKNDGNTPNDAIGESEEFTRVVYLTLTADDHYLSVDYGIKYANTMYLYDRSLSLYRVS